MIKKTNTGKFQVDVRPNGHTGKRVRKSFKTKAEAKRFQAHLLHMAASNDDWNPDSSDERRLLDLCERWHDVHGHTLKDKKRIGTLRIVCNGMNNPRADQFTPSLFMSYRQRRLDEGLNPNTANHYHAYLKAVFSELIRIDEWKGENPMKKVRKLKVDEKELSYLTKEQIDHLLYCLDESGSKTVGLVARICLATGARWSEAEGLHSSDVRGNLITFKGTKSGKVRSIPISKDIAAMLPKQKGKLFTSCLKAFRRALEKSGIETPAGQASHILRHSFASHFMMNGGGILTLQRILGHSSLTMTMRYAHLSPDHLNEAAKLNPLDFGTQKS